MADTLAPVRSGTDSALYALIEQAPDSIFVASAMDGRYTYVNQAACRLLGYARDEIIGKTIVDLIPPEDAPRLAESRKEMLAGRRHVAEWKLRRKDGTWVPVEVSANILPDGQWHGFVRDISERKAMEAERDELFQRIDAKRRWLQTVIDTVPLGLLLFEPDGKLSFNRRTEELLGMKLSRTGGNAQFVSRIRFADGRPAPREQLVSSRVLRGETVVAEEFLVERPDGSRITVLSSGAPIRDEAGALIGGVGVFQDVSERMRAEQAIRENERLLSAIFGLLPVGVWIADKSGRIVRVNPAGEAVWRGARYVGLPEFGQYKGWWLESGKPIEAGDWALARALTRGETSTGELVRIQCFDGSFKTIINSAAPLRGEHGEIEGAIVVNEDITALYRTQEQLRTAVRDREDILAIVSHDLRNPLSGLMMSATAAERLAANLPGGGRVRELAASLIDITRGMSGLVDDLLAVAVAQTGRSMLKIAPMSAAALVARAAASARPLFARRGVELEVVVAGELPAIQVDSDRILRVFANLLDNALKFTDSPGRVVLRAEEAPAAVRYCVANTGAPLSAEEREQMFQPFWQAGREDRRGAGLGLSICRSIVEAHGGSIWAEPAEGKRVRVCFLLPRVKSGP